MAQQKSFDGKHDGHVVGIGASAGGLEALEELFQSMPTNTGMSFVIVQHLSPDFESVMDELLLRKTNMTVQMVTDAMAIEPNSVYLIPPKKEMILAGGKLLLKDKDRDQGLSLPIDQFFRSLARECGELAIAVILSGTGSDGSRGIREIHAAGGLGLSGKLVSERLSPAGRIGRHIEPLILHEAKDGDATDGNPGN